MPDFKPRSKHKEPKPKEREATSDIEGQKRIAEAPVIEGVNAHLQADPSELDITGPCLAKLRKAGVTSIAQLCKLYDDESKDPRAELSLGENQDKDLREALGKFRKKHRIAQIDAERT